MMSPTFPQVPSQSQVGGRSDGDRPVSALPEAGRSWVLELPAGTVLLTANHRLHRMQANAVTRDLKNTAVMLARAQRVPRLGLVDVLVSYLPPPRNRRDRHPLASARVEDADNLAPTSKALIDGLTKAGVWSSDSRRHVRRVAYQLEAGSCPRGRLRLHITELAALREPGRSYGETGAAG